MTNLQLEEIEVHATSYPVTCDGPAHCNVNEKLCFLGFTGLLLFLLLGMVRKRKRGGLVGHEA